MSLLCLEYMLKGSSVIAVKRERSPTVDESEIGMTKEEMQRYLKQRAEEGNTQLEALEKLMEVLGVEMPNARR